MTSPVNSGNSCFFFFLLLVREDLGQASASSTLLIYCFVMAQPDPFCSIAPTASVCRHILKAIGAAEQKGSGLGDEHEPFLIGFARLAKQDLSLSAVYINVISQKHT